MIVNEDLNRIIVCNIRVIRIQVLFAFDRKKSFLNI